MELIQFHKLRTGVQSNASPGSREDLTSVEAALKHSLEATGLFEEVEVETTEDPDHLVIGLCKFAPNLSESQVASRLEQLWEDRVRYQFWEAHATLVDEDHVEFEAATRSGTAGHYVTVHIVAQKATIPVQRSWGY